MSDIPAWVERRLKEWGDEYRMDWDAEGREKNVLHDFIRFKGPPPRGTRPYAAPHKEADDVEDIVRKLGQTNAAAAMCLRAKYCGRGYQSDKAKMCELSLASFKSHVRMGEMYVAGALGERRVA